MYGEGGCVRIARAENGYTVSMRDPKIVAANAKRELSNKSTMPWMDPNKEYVFADFATMSDFLEKNLDKALPKPSFEASFDALSDDED